MTDRGTRQPPSVSPPRRTLSERAIYQTARLSSAAGFMLIYRARAYGAWRVPITGPVLLAANHQSHFDPPLIGGFVPQRPLSYVARSGLFGSRLFSWLIRSLNAIPLKENTGDAGAIREVLERLGQGGAVLIFPEGSRTPDGAIQEYKRGVALLVKRAKCPVVPIAIEGGFEAWPRHRKAPRVFGQRIALMFGEPIAHEELMRDGADAALDRLKAQTERMQQELRERLGLRSRIDTSSGG